MVREPVPLPVAPSTADPAPDEGWRRDNVGRLLSNALRRFEARVIELLAQAGHDAVTQSHINATRHLDVGGTRLVDQLEQKGLVARRPDPLDGRARLVCFTPAGLAWLDDFRVAVKQAEREMGRTVGADALRTLKAALHRYDAAGR